MMTLPVESPVETAARYAAAGIPVFPCANKMPLTAHGFLDASTDAEQIKTWWLTWPHAQIGMPTGAASRRIVIDTDRKPGIDGDQTWQDLILRHPTEKPGDGPTARTPRGGRHYHFAHPGEPISSSVCQLGIGIDVRGDGGYVILPPSTGYEWLDDSEDLVPPPCPAWLLELLRTKPRAASSLAEVTVIPDGQRNQTLTRYAGTMRRANMSADAMAAALRVMNQQQCVPPLPDQEVERIAKSVARYAPDQATQAIVEGWGLTPSPDADAPTTDLQDPGPFPKHLLAVPGLMGSLMAHMEGGAFKSQPVLALGAAIAAVGTLAGRRIQTERGTRTNVYCLGVCESGGGKERAREVVKTLFHAAGCEQLLGPEDLASEAGLITAIATQPVLLFQLDEVGRLLKTMGDASRSPHLYGIITALLKLYSSARSVYRGKAYADADRNIAIVQPSVSLYGTTVPKSLWEGLTVEAITDGFLARMLIFSSDDHDPRGRKVKAEHLVLPPLLVEQVRAIASQPYPGGNLASTNPVPVVVERTPDADGRFDVLEEVVRTERAALKGHDLATLWTRTVEKADQLALVYAFSAAPACPRIDDLAAVWACDLSAYLTRRVAWEARRHMAGNGVERERNKVVEAIRRAGKEGMTKSQMLRAMRTMKARDLAEQLSTLVESGELSLETIQTVGRNRQVYRLAGAVDQMSMERREESGSK